MRTKESPVTASASQGISPRWFWGAAILTGALAGAAAAVGALALHSRSSYEESPTEEGYNQFTNYRLATNILWGATAAAAATGTFLFFYSDFGSSPKATPTSRAAQVFGLGLKRSF